MLTVPVRDMHVEVTPVVPKTLGEIIHVTVLDAENRTPIDGAEIKISKDGLATIFRTLTRSDGAAQFEFPGAVTVIIVSKKGYRGSMKIIPKIPDEWMRVYAIQKITWTVTIITSFGPALLLYYLSRKEKEAETQLQVIDMKPKWTEESDYKFVNIYGEEWYAKINKDCSVTITGSDVGWEEKTIDAETPIDLERETLYPYVMHKAEAMWLKSVLLVASYLKKSKTR